jgi:hypothetical protein
MNKLAISLLLFALSSHLVAADFSTTNIHMLHGKNYKLGEKERTFMNVEHFTAHSTGDLFFFFDTEHPFNNRTSHFGLVAANWSSAKNIFNQQSYDGFLQDISLATTLELGASGAKLVGLSFDFKVPRFVLFRVITLLRNKKPTDGTSIQTSWVWALPFNLGSTSWLFEGFADYITAEGADSMLIVTQPRLLLDLGKLTLGSVNKVYIGVEYAYAKNKFGNKGVNESVVQCMIKWVL